MARIRTVKPGFWKDEDLSELPSDTHMLAAALLNYADDEGYFNANPALVKAECCPLREPSVSVHESLKLLQKIGYLKLGSCKNGKSYGHVVTFADHQKVSHPTASKIKQLQIIWEDSRNPHGILTEDSALKGIEGKGKEDMGGQPAPPDDFDKKFTDLQAIYPKRSGDQRWQTAKKHIRARLREGHTWPEILDGARRYAEWVRTTGKERTETVKQAATFVGADKAFAEPWTPPEQPPDPKNAHAESRVVMFDD